MPSHDSAFWAELYRRTLRRYDEALLRRVAARLIRPRNQWPVDELVERCTATTSDVALIDRRLRDLEPAERQLLALIGHSRQPVWALGSLVELVMSLEHEDGLKPIVALLEAGLLLPFLRDEADSIDKGEATATRTSVRSFEHWLAFAGSSALQVFAHPVAMSRAVGEDLGLGACPGRIAAGGPVVESDGLEWPLRLSALWQLASATPLRRTQQGEFFKRDLDRLGGDALLNAPPAEGLPTVPEASFLAVALAEQFGILEESDGELRAAALPENWEQGPATVLETLWSAVPRVQTWNPIDGWRHGESVGNPFPAAYLLALLLLSRLPADAWSEPAAIQAWIAGRHPYWSGDRSRSALKKDWASPFLLGLAYQLRMTQVARTADEGWAVRLSPTGRWLLGLADAPAVEPPFPRALLVQPNLEIVAYRQGLTPSLIARLTRFAQWRSLGSACTLQLGPESVYRALEGGVTFETIVQTLEQHGTRAIPAAVIDSLRTWSDKRDRISVYPAAALLEFAAPEDLDAALARGFPGIRIGDRLAIVPGESSIDYSMFRLTSSRDYAAPPDRCISVGHDGVTLTVDLAKADLLLESELARFAEPVDGPAPAGQRIYRLTPTTLTAARNSGMPLQVLQTWFHQRVGEPLSPAAFLLFSGAELTPPTMEQHLVLHVASEEIADGLLQWPATRRLIRDRLGPTALSVSPEDAATLRELLTQIGLTTS